VRRLQERGTVAALSRASGPDAPAARAIGGTGHPHARRLLLALVVAAAVVVADQVTKSLALGHLHRPVHVVGPVGLRLGFNTGSAFSLFSGHAPALTVVDVVLVAGLVALAWWAHSAGTAVAVGLVLGGALGNLGDRVFRGHHGGVVDFITLTHWPTFNLADACIDTGVVLFVVLQFRRPGSSTAPAASPPAAP
jgi:signal peptidase II